MLEHSSPLKFVSFFNFISLQEKMSQKSYSVVFMIFCWLADNLGGWTKLGAAPWRGPPKFHTSSAQIWWCHTPLLTAEPEVRDQIGPSERAIFSIIIPRNRSPYHPTHNVWAFKPIYTHKPPVMSYMEDTCSQLSPRRAPQVRSETWDVYPLKMHQSVEQKMLDKSTYCNIFTQSTPQCHGKCSESW